MNNIVLQDATSRCGWVGRREDLFFVEEFRDEEREARVTDVYI